MSRRGIEDGRNIGFLCVSRTLSILGSCVECSHKRGNAQKAESGAREVMTIINATGGHQECGFRKPEAGLQVLAKDQK